MYSWDRPISPIGSSTCPCSVLIAWNSLNVTRFSPHFPHMPSKITVPAFGNCIYSSCENTRCIKCFAIYLDFPLNSHIAKTCCCIRCAGNNCAIVFLSVYIWNWSGAHNRESTNHSARFVKWESWYITKSFNHGYVMVSLVNRPSLTLLGLQWVLCLALSDKTEANI